MKVIEFLERFYPENSDRFIFKQNGETLLDEVYPFPIKEIPEEYQRIIETDFYRITIEPIDDNVVITLYLEM